MGDDEGERAFEARLDRMFAVAPAFGDADPCTLRVSDSLGRGWTPRCAKIWALGLAAGMVVVAQAASSGVIAQAHSLPHHSGAAIGRALSHVLPWRLSISGLPFSGELVWKSAALAALALGFVVVRAIKEV